MFLGFAECFKGCNNYSRCDTKCLEPILNVTAVILNVSDAELNVKEAILNVF